MQALPLPPDAAEVDVLCAGRVLAATPSLTTPTLSLTLILSLSPTLTLTPTLALTLTLTLTLTPTRATAPPGASGSASRAPWMWSCWRAGAWASARHSR